MEKDTRKNRITHKRVGLLKERVDKRIKKENTRFYNREGRKPNIMEEAAIRKYARRRELGGFISRVVVGVSAPILLGTGVYKLGASSERIKGVEQDSKGNVTANTYEMDKDTDLQVQGPSEKEIFINGLKVDIGSLENAANEYMENEEKTNEREELKAQIEKDVEDFHTKEDVWKYAKNLYATEYGKETGGILGVNSFDLEVFRSGNLKATDRETQGIIEMVVDGQNAEAENKWYLAKDGSTVLYDLSDVIRNLEKLREEYNKGTKKEELGSLNDKVTESLMSYYDAQQAKEQNEQGKDSSEIEH